MLMKPYHFPRGLLRLSMLAVLAFPISGFAQYVWLDNKGVKQYSDRPPTESVPASRMLKQPGGIPKSAPEEEQAASEKAAPPLADRNMEFKKRQAERQEQEKKIRESSQQSQDMERNCQRARDYQRSIDSGERIARLDGNGERVYLNDEQRSAEARDNRRILDKCSK
jgi:hypothetical protein